ncbi:MAG TPA: GTPase HflX, partial [Burkholderiaceae bacterium]
MEVVLRERGAPPRGGNGGDAADAAEELKHLVRSAGLEPVAFAVARRDRPDPAHYVGSGKLEQLQQLLAEHAASIVIVDAALSPVQQRNLERALGTPVVDRTALILEIFAQRAQSREGKL